MMVTSPRGIFHSTASGPLKKNSLETIPSQYFVSVPVSAVIMMTAHGTVETAVEAMKKGAFDYISKPLDKDQILTVIRKALDVDTYRRKHDYMPGPADIFEDIVGKSREMLELFAVIERVAPTDASVLTLMACLPIFNSFPTPPPSGTVQRLLESAYQFPVIMMSEMRYQPLSRL